MEFVPDSSAKDVSPTVNGINLENISLSSSRSRRRRSSQGRKSISEEEGSPIHGRRSVPTDSSQNSDSLKKVSSTSALQNLQKSSVPLRKPNSNDRLSVEKKTKNRDSDIVLDVNSILDQLMGSGGFDGSSDDEEIKLKEPVKSSPSRSPKSNKEQTSPSRTKIDEELPVYSLRSNRSRAATKAVEASLGNKEREEVSRFDKKPPVSPQRQPTKSVREDSSSKTSSVVNRRQSPEVKPLSPKQQAPPEFNVSLEEEKQLKSRGLVSQTHRRKEEGLTNGHLKEKRESIDDEEDFRMRVRSNAVNKYDRLKVHALKDIQQEILEEEKQQTKVKETPREDTVPSSRRKNRPASNTGLEPSIGRSGSFSRRQRMSGDKALGMFYHSRHSQFIDLDTLDESEKNLRGSSLERSGSFNDPRSPTSRSRDLRSYSPRDHDGRESSSFSPIPQSPLVSKSHFEVENGARNEMSGEGVMGRKEEGGVRPLSPRITVQKEEDEPEVSELYKLCNVVEACGGALIHVRFI